MTAIHLDKKTIYPNFTDILRFKIKFDKILNYSEQKDKFIIELIELNSLFWRILWSSNPEKCYNYVLELRNNHTPNIYQISKSIAELGNIYFNEINYMKVPHDFGLLLSTVESLADPRAGKYIVNLLNQYASLDKTYFRYLINDIARIIVPMKRMVRNLLFKKHNLENLILDTENKIAYFVALVETFAESEGMNYLDRLCRPTDLIKMKINHLLDYFNRVATEMKFEDMILEIALVRDGFYYYHSV